MRDRVDIAVTKIRIKSALSEYLSSALERPAVRGSGHAAHPGSAPANLAPRLTHRSQITTACLGATAESVAAVEASIIGVHMGWLQVESDQRKCSA
ncbi:hypothetical protein KC365_g5 [Hortaea werneckii]|nr:hypothetical protein KC339_g5 [Hortaea werneckii]KAI7245811.1 hypothetical protein KC365_g5 [Hortaea werneckii]